MSSWKQTNQSGSSQCKKLSCGSQHIQKVTGQVNGRDIHEALLNTKATPPAQETSKSENFWRVGKKKIKVNHYISGKCSVLESFPKHSSLQLP